MKDPDSALFAQWNRLHATGQMVGRERPIGRITIQNPKIKHFISPTRPGPWRTIQFAQNTSDTVKTEMPNVKSIDISRAVGQDAATCSIVLYNNYMKWDDHSLEGVDVDDKVVGRPGYFSPYRGTALDNPPASVLSRHVPLKDLPIGGWSYNEGTGAYVKKAYPENIYKDLLLPNRMVRTYQGYGSDNMDADGNLLDVGDPGYVAPEDDTSLTLTGTWLIDSVQMSSDGLISIECRDVAKLLLEHFIYPDVLPMDRFPLQYCPVESSETVVGATEGTAGTADEEQAVIGGNTITGLGAPSGYYESSNDPWYGRNASLYGHRPSHAFDSNDDSYWLSVGNGNPQGAYAYEYVTGKSRGDDINEVLVTTKGGNYIAYISIWENGAWQGTSTVPYDPNNPNSFPNGSDINYVKKVTLSKDVQTTIKLDRKYKAEYVRVCLHNLWDSNLGTNQYRGAIRELRARHVYTKLVKGTPGTAGSEGTVVTESNEGEPGIITDWSDAIKELCGWAGLTWGHGIAPETELYPAPASPDPLLGYSEDGAALRIWGDIMYIGAGPVNCTPPEWFLQKSFMEGINLVKDLLGCIFYIDETGAAVFRLPNIFRPGNYVTDLTATDPRVYREEHPIEFHENVNLTNYTVTLDDSQLRSKIIVIGTNPDVNSDAILSGSVDADTAGSFRWILRNQQRVMVVPGENTKGFETAEECERMAEMVALYILFTFRRSQLSSPCHPGLQVDDQVRIYERTSGEHYVHYVSGLDTHMDMESGEYTMDVTTHWLGSEPGKSAADWFTDMVNLDMSEKLAAIADQYGTAKPASADEVEG